MLVSGSGSGRDKFVSSAGSECNRQERGDFVQSALKFQLFAPTTKTTSLSQDDPNFFPTMSKKALEKATTDAAKTGALHKSLFLC